MNVFVGLRSLSRLLLGCNGDTFLITLIQLAQGILSYQDHSRDRRTGQNAFRVLAAMTEVARDIHNFMVASLPELEELAQEYDEDEKLSRALLHMLRCVRGNLKEATGDFTELWEVLVTNFPVDTDTLGSRFSCKNNSIGDSIWKLKDKYGGSSLDTEHDLVSNYSELLLMDVLECSFLIVLDVNQVLMDRSPRVKRKQALLNLKLEKFCEKLEEFRSSHEKAVSCCETFFQRYFEELEKLNDGSPMSIENRFSIEFKLYQNSESMSKVLAQISETLSSIQTESLSMLPVTKSSDALDDMRDSNVTLLTAQQARADSFQKFHGILESRMNTLNKYWKLESQLLRKILHRNFPKSSSRIQLNDRDNEAKEADTQSLDFESNDQINMTEEAGVVSYETLGEDEQDGGNREILDEYFELVMRREEDREDKESFVDGDEDEDGVQEARQVVLDQLKTVLKPRQEFMKCREEEAYRRTYGNKLAESDSSEDDEPLLPVKTNRVRQEVFWGDQKAEDGDSGSGDDGVSSGRSSPLVPADFKSRLDSILKTGGGFPQARLSSSPEND